MTIKAVGFDLGETLICYRDVPLSWQSLYGEALADVAARCGLTLTASDAETGERALARYNTRLHPRVEEVTAAEVLGDVLAAWGLSRGAHLEAAESAFFGYFQRQAEPYDDVPPVLEDLRARGGAIGVLTDVPYGMSRDYVQHDLRSLSLYVDALVTSVEAGRRKPDPAGYFALANALGVGAGEMLYVGNEEKDVEGANRAGLRSVLLDRDGMGDDYGQAATIHSLRDLKDLLA